MPVLALNIPGAADLYDEIEEGKFLFQPEPMALAALMLQCLQKGVENPRPRISSLDARWRDMLNLWVLSTNESAYKRKELFLKKAKWPSVCAVIVSFNRLKLINDAVMSIEKQTYPGLIETIVIDDNSHEAGIPKYLKTISRGWGMRPRTISINSHSKYLGASRNAGVQACSLPYIIFLDDDDLLKPHAVQLMMTSLQSSGADTVSGLSDVVRKWPLKSPDDYDYRYLFTGSLSSSGLFGNVFGAYSVLAKTSVLRTSPYSELRDGLEDWEFSANVVLQGYRYELVPDGVLTYRRISEGLTMSESLNLPQSYQRILRQYTHRFSAVADALRVLMARTFEVQDTQLQASLESGASLLLDGCDLPQPVDLTGNLLDGHDFDNFGSGYTLSSSSCYEAKNANRFANGFSVNLDAPAPAGVYAIGSWIDLVELDRDRNLQDHVNFAGLYADVSISKSDTLFGWVAQIPPNSVRGSHFIFSLRSFPKGFESVKFYGMMRGLGGSIAFCRPFLLPFAQVKCNLAALTAFKSRRKTHFDPQNGCGKMLEYFYDTEGTSVETVIKVLRSSPARKIGLFSKRLQIEDLTNLFLEGRDISLFHPEDRCFSTQDI